MTLLPLLVPFAVLPLCALSDVATFKIPNRYVAVLLAAWLPVQLLAGAGQHEVGMTALVGGTALLACLLLFALGAFGAGDGKLLPTAMLWVGYEGALQFLYLTAMLGGAMCLLLVMVRARPLPVPAMRYGWVVRMHDAKRKAPYGVPIAGAAMITMALGTLPA